MFGIISYDVKISNHILPQCKYNCLLQKLNVDSSRSEICVEDYNGLVPDMLSKAEEKGERLETKYIGQIPLNVTIANGDVRSNIFYMDILNILCRGIKTTNKCNDELISHIINQMNILFNEGVIMVKGLKRFISERIGKDEIIFNPYKRNADDGLMYYILFIVGLDSREKMQMEDIKDLILKEFGTREIILDDETVIRKIDQLKKMEKYSDIIKNGAKKIQRI